MGTHQSSGGVHVSPLCPDSALFPSLIFSLQFTCSTFRPPPGVPVESPRCSSLALMCSSLGCMLCLHLAGENCSIDSLVLGLLPRRLEGGLPTVMKTDVLLFPCGNFAICSRAIFPVESPVRLHLCSKLGDFSFGVKRICPEGKGQATWGLPRLDEPAGLPHAMRV